ncbi:tannase/feruloyl esterase family alpha/beta hydrolase [Undibacterium sp. SXout7W]|uniref:tannase/feruloyl esterase family alpha/beta hydrolase n=1 Tax=Undibacterium sp. SXout7W TaxID=3413049 RepID=UPI003BF10FD1
MKGLQLTGTAAAVSALLLTACGGSDSTQTVTTTPLLPQLTAATGANLATCASLVGRLTYPDTTVTAVNDIAAGAQTVAGKAVPRHCQVIGQMFQRVSPVDGQRYAIGFEMRLPLNWNGRFFYQANGGTDGVVLAATGPVGGGGPLDHALNQGFAVISSDAGHSDAQNPTFGIDPQARLDYGYQAVGKLTPMAKSFIKSTYGKEPDRSYIGGCSNGGRHTLVAAARYAELYDGFLVGDPGIRLPLASIANLAGAKLYNKLATTPGDLSTGFTLAERALVSNAVLAKCDSLDGVKDGLVQDVAACQAAFNFERDVPVCSGARDGTCLSPAQKTAIGSLFTGATTESGNLVYTSFPYDAGLATAGWASWKFNMPTQRNAGAIGLIWQSPPENATGFDAQNFLVNGNIESMVAKVNATSGLYTESGMSFMTPPNRTDLSAVKKRGGKLLAYHGTSDPIFSSNDTAAWYESVRAANGGDASNFARYFPVPGMNHCSGGPATEQFDMLTPLVNWVEKGLAPDVVQASVRGPGNSGGVSADVPSSWAANRTRPLCAYPKVAKYKGSGSIEDAANFSCS